MTVPRIADPPPAKPPNNVRLVAALVAVALGTVAVAASFWMESWDRLLDGGRLVFIAPAYLGGWRVNAEMSVHLRQVGGGGLGVGVAILIADLLRRAGRRASPPR